ncbi:MAG: endonuclease/exonuclease/phosphatase family protein [Alphaproteobacteria bacterium]|nr:endonuclease/exonuclease/phosphatase family protein [Alphaproteobacteria bacterium]
MALLKAKTETSPQGDKDAKPKRSRHRDWSGATMALGLGLAGLIGGRMGILWIRFDVISQFSVQFALLAAAGALGIFAPRFKSLAAGVFFVLFIVGYGVWPLLATGGSEAAVQANEKQLRVAQFNVHGAFTNPAEIAAVIRQMNPDVMTLVELAPPSKAMLEELKAEWPYQATCWQEGDCELAILSKFPLTGQHGQNAWEGPAYLQASLGPEFGGLTVMATHTTRFPFARAQFHQVLALAKALETEQGPLLVMGDFNATPFSRVTQVFAETAGLKRLTTMPSWPADQGLPQIAIDHIFVSPGLRPLTGEHIGLAGGSDHFPISMSLAVAAK